ncbi:MAG: hypothetical protein ACYTEP_02280 [Planctomycetota bacterium]|jgi:hypothetical protein
MNPNNMRCLIPVPALALCSLLAVGCQSEAPRASDLIADSVGGFSGQQGDNGWSYGYWDRSADVDKAYSQGTDFHLLRHFGDDPRNQLSSHTEFTTGKLWYLEDGLYYTSLWAKGGHPHGTMDLGTYARAEHWAVRRWVSSTSGPVSITGHAGKEMPWGANWSGDVRARIVVDGVTLFDTAIDDGVSMYDVGATVHPGSLVDFLIGPGESVGVVEFTGTIRTAPAQH